MQEEEKDILITKYLSGELNQEENAKVDAWRKEADENERYFFEMKSIWEMVDQPASTIQFDVDKAWQKVQKRNHSEVTESGSQSDTTKTKEIVYQVQRRSWWFAAAALVAISLLGWLVLQQPREAELHTLYASTESISLQLPDGSHITLNTGSTLTYPEFFSETREVSLEGEAYFEIAKDSLHPFKIDANTAVIQVLGTAFNVNTKTSANNGAVEVNVTEGKVMLAEKTDTETLTTNRIILTKGEAAVYKSKEKKIEKLAQVDPNAIAWKTKTLQFDRTTLSEVLKNIEKAYQVQFTLENPMLAQCQLSGVFREQPLEVLLQTIEVSFGATVVKDSENHYTIKGEGCPAP